jgi:poly(hydroxyalkanoate) granule-associated protein
MAKLKKSVRKSSAGHAGARSDSEHLARTLSESAQQIWLAGVGAFNRAQAEGTKLFESLVKEGMSLEQTARKFAGGRADVVRDAVEGRVGSARERAADTWDRLEKVFEDRVQRALLKLGVPARADLAALIERVDALNAELRKLGGAPAAKPPVARKAPAATKAPAGRKPVARKTTGKAATGKAAPRKGERAAE